MKKLLVMVASFAGLCVVVRALGPKMQKIDWDYDLGRGFATVRSASTAL